MKQEEAAGRAARLVSPEQAKAEPAAAAGLDRSAFRRFASHFVTGVSVVTTRDAEGRLFGLTVNSVTSLSLEPPLYLVCLSNACNTLPALLESGVFAIHFLAESQEEVCRRFASKEPDKFSLVPHAAGSCGAPLIEKSLACCECRLEAVYPGGDHSIVVGAVEALHIGEERPLVFYQGQLRGLS